jgi:hypothetical protein
LQEVDAEPHDEHQERFAVGKHGTSQPGKATLRVV